MSPYASLEDFRALPSEERDAKIFQILTALSKDVESLKSSRLNHVKGDSAATHFTAASADPPCYKESSGDGGEVAAARQDGPVTLNVGGKKFETTWSQFSSLPPQSRLFKLSQCSNNKDDILQLCDAFHAESNEYRFNRSPRNFDCILDVMATGKLHLGQEACVTAFKQDMDYWGISTIYLEPCCTQRYHEQRQSLSWNHVDQNEDEMSRNSSGLGRMRNTLWNLFDNPGSSPWAVLVSTVSMVGIIAAIAIQALYSVEGLLDTNLRFQGDRLQAYYPPFVFIDSIYLLWFILEFTIRLICCPSKIHFALNLLNWIDLLAILSYLTAVIGVGRGFEYDLFMFFRVLRILRILKLASHTRGLRSLGSALRASWKELILLALLVGATAVIFGSLAYYLEKNINQSFSSLMRAHWWAIITITTVGYGDYIPMTWWGKIVASLCAVCGLFFIALPLPIIGYNFVVYYKYEGRRKLCAKNKVALERAKKSEEVQMPLLSGSNIRGDGQIEA